MLNSFQSILIMLATMAAAVCFLFLVRRLWPSELRRQQNDLIGWNVGVLGSAYAVIMGFMLFAVWTNFETADSDADAEANCLVNVARSSRGLPVAQRAQVLSLAREYANLMITDEWPAMSRVELSPRLTLSCGSFGQRSWRPKPMRASSKRVYTTRSELGKMTEYRRLRQLQVTSHLPSILWLVLILGAIVTIMSACLFGTSDLLVHLVQVILLSLLISSVLVAIADINRPFQGAVHVDPIGFERARLTLADIA